MSDRDSSRTQTYHPEPVGTAVGFGPDFLSLLRRAVPPAEAAPPGRVGRFEVLGPLGRGGFGTVLLARDPDLDRLRALKLPGPAALACPDALARFLREGRRAARVDHPNVARVYEAGHDGRTAYLAMEFCPGGSLADWLAARPPGRPLPPGWAAELVARVADGVAAAHAAGILHRDLKPGNVLLAPDPDATGPGPGPDPPAFRPKVGDFGLAKLLGPGPAGDDPTAAGVALGTLPYMSPEAARGDALGPAADVYALGVILFQLLTRRRPFEAPSDAALLGRITSPEPAPRARALRPGLPRDLDAACAAALAKDPADRYPSPAAFADDLRRCLRGEPVRGAPWWRRARAALRRRRARLALIAVAVSVALAASWLVGFVRRVETDALIRRLETVEASGLPELAPRIDPSDPAVAARLGLLYDSGTPGQRLAAAVALAPARPECGGFALARLLEARPETIGPIARALEPRAPGLIARLEAEVDGAAGPEPSPEGPGEAADRRIANAACALAILGREAQAWRLLRASPAPQARSFLIHALGPSGVAPGRLVDRLDGEPEASARRALIQAMGEVPEASWTAEARARARDRALRLYEHDPDAGVHASAKWLLRRWGMKDALGEIDARLAAAPAPAGRRWRIGPMGLTFVAMEDPASGRVVEVSDSEVTVAQFLKFRPDHEFSREQSPAADCPITGVSYLDAVAFLAWLDGLEGRPGAEGCYRPVAGPRGDIAAVPDYRERPGYRLPEIGEALRAGGADVPARRFYGDSDALLGHYAWFLENAGGMTHEAGSLKPNELGLFDTLGNVREWCEASPWAEHQPQQAIYGQSFTVAGKLQASAGDRATRRTAKTMGFVTDGFRVARTVRPR